MIYRALSLKQPWAALLAHGLKTVDVRRWSTRYRGELLIHAARIADERPEAWAHVPAPLQDAARLEGGVIGVGVVTDCVRYSTREAFEADCARHLNDPSWFEPAGLYGLCFCDLRVLPFYRVPGYVRIFEVEADDLVIPAAVPPVAEGGDGTHEAIAQRIGRLSRSLPGKKG